MSIIGEIQPTQPAAPAQPATATNNTNGSNGNDTSIFTAKNGVQVEVRYFEGTHIQKGIYALTDDLQAGSAAIDEFKFQKQTMPLERPIAEPAKPKATAPKPTASNAHKEPKNSNPFGALPLLPSQLATNWHAPMLLPEDQDAKDGKAIQSSYHSMVEDNRNANVSAGFHTDKQRAAEAGFSSVDAYTAAIDPDTTKEFTTSHSAPLSFATSASGGASSVSEPPKAPTAPAVPVASPAPSKEEIEEQEAANAGFPSVEAYRASLKPADNFFQANS